MDVLQVEGLCKRYERFALRDVSFRVPEGHIMGFIGRNGAGKTTTLKCLLGQARPDAGAVRFFGKAYPEHELFIKQRIAFVSGGIRFYPRRTLRTLTQVTRRFYPAWDADAYARLMERFRLDECKRADELSEGMKVKYLLALALSHRARLLLLDEPTSGLDPVSRDELLDIFLRLAGEEGVTILFSTHITSDLDKCADDILYMREGEAIACEPTASFTSRYLRVQGPQHVLASPFSELLIGCRAHAGRFQALLPRQGGTAPLPEAVQTAPATLEDIMVCLDRRERDA